MKNDFKLEDITPAVSELKTQFEKLVFYARCNNLTLNEVINQITIMTDDLKEKL